MPDVSGPFDGASFGQGPWYRDRGWSEPDGVPGPMPATAAAGELPLTANGLTLSLGVGRGRVRGAAYERTATAWTVAVPANSHATQSRIDRVVLRRDLVAKTVVPALLQGTPAASPVPPAPTQVENGTWELPLHRVTVPPASGTVLTIVDERPILDPSTSQLLGYGAGSAVRPTTGLFDGMRLYEQNTDRWIERKAGVWRLGKPEVLHVAAHTANSLSNVGWAGTTFAWVAGLGAKIGPLPVDGITRDVVIAGKSQIAGDGALRVRRDGDADVYWPNSSGARSSASTEDGMTVLATDHAVLNVARSYYLEARSTVAAGASFYVPQLEVVAY